MPCDGFAVMGHGFLRSVSVANQESGLNLLGSGSIVSLVWEMPHVQAVGTNEETDGSFRQGNE